MKWFFYCLYQRPLHTLTFTGFTRGFINLTKPRIKSSHEQNKRIRLIKEQKCEDRHWNTILKIILVSVSIILLVCLSVCKMVNALECHSIINMNYKYKKKENVSTVIVHLEHTAINTHTQPKNQSHSISIKHIRGLYTKLKRHFYNQLG